MHDRNQPQFGYGHFDWPLWTARDRDAEAIREVLRRAGRREFTLGLATETTERHGGFVVEDGEALTAAGYQVLPDADDELVLQVRR